MIGGMRNTITLAITERALSSRKLKLAHLAPAMAACRTTLLHLLEFAFEIFDPAHRLVVQIETE